MIELQKVEDVGPVAATWAWCENCRQTGARVVLVHCPRCGNVGHINEHQVWDNGIVRPRITCPDDDCGFAGEVRLKGYEAPVTGGHTDDCDTQGP